MTSMRYGWPSLSLGVCAIAVHIEGRRRKMDGDDGSRLPWQYAFVASSCLDFILKRRVRHPCHRTEHNWAAGDFVSVLLPWLRISQAQNRVLTRPDWGDLLISLVYEK